jgi:hypothetical protein
MDKNSDATPNPGELRNELHPLFAEAESLGLDFCTERSNEVMGDVRERFAAAQERITELYGVAKKKGSLARNAPRQPSVSSPIRRWLSRSAWVF